LQEGYSLPVSKCSLPLHNPWHDFSDKSTIHFQNPRCPSRNYRQGEPSDDIALAGSHDDNLEVIPARNVTADTVQVATLENGFQVMSLFGTHQVGDEVWMHDDTLQNGIISKVAKVGSLRDARAVRMDSKSAN
jgi:hypothetical protein